MNKRKILEAYDSITPTDAQRERMLYGILKKETGREVHYMEKSRKTQILRPLTVAAVLVFVACIWLVTGADWQEQIPVVETTDPPTLETWETTVPQETEEDQIGILLSDQNVNFSEFPEYVQILNKYLDARKGKWSPSTCEAAGLSRVYADYVALNSDRLGFAVQDFDGNGIEELLICHDSLILDLYTLAENTPIKLFQSEVRSNAMFLCQNGMLCNIRLIGGDKNNAEIEIYDQFAAAPLTPVMAYAVMNGQCYACDQSPMDNWFPKDEISEIPEEYHTTSISYTTFLEYRIDKGLFTLLNDHNYGAAVKVEGNYAVVYITRKEREMVHSLVLVECQEVNGEFYLTRRADGEYAISGGLSLNHVEVEGKHIYFGTITETHWNPTNDAVTQLYRDHLLVTDGEGNTRKIPCQQFQEFLFILDSPLADFQVISEDGAVTFDYKTYTAHGYTIWEVALTPVLEDEDSNRIAQVEEAITAQQQELERIQNAVQKNQE